MGKLVRERILMVRCRIADAKRYRLVRPFSKPTAPSCWHCQRSCLQCVQEVKGANSLLVDTDPDWIRDDAVGYGEVRNPVDFSAA